MKIAVIRFPGTNNELETVRALRSFNVEAEVLDHKLIDKVGSYDGYWLAGGFSYADVLRAGAIASQSEMVNSIEQSQMPVIGVCNGFQIMTEAGMLPGALLPNNSTRFICKWVYLKIDDTVDIESEKKVLKLPIAHFEGNLFEDPSRRTQPLIYYSSAEGEISPKFNPNGSDQNIAGSVEGRYMGLMPHPERASFAHQGSTDGRAIISAFLKEVKA